MRGIQMLCVTLGFLLLLRIKAEVLYFCDVLELSLPKGLRKVNRYNGKLSGYMT